MRKLVMPKEPSRVQPRSVEDLNAELQSEWDKTIRTWGIPNHLYATMCCQPQLGLTEVDYANSFIFDEGGFTTLPLPGDRKRRVLFPTAGFVDRVTKELALSIVSLLNRSRYSITHHSLIATGTLSELVQGSTPARKKARAEAMLLHLVDADGHVDFENQLHDGKPLYSDLQLATLRFAVKLNSDPHSLTDDDFAALKKVQREEAIRQIKVHRLDAQFGGKVPELYIGAYVDAMLVELTWCLCHFSGLLNRWFTALRVRDEQERVNGTPSFVDSYNAAVPESVKQRNNQLLGERGWGQHSSAHTPFALEKYDSRRNGPLLGVSDEGSAAATIVDAAYRSAKAQASSSPCAAVVGMIVDGERMTSAGEVPIGPDEYAQILPAVAGRTFCSTNVGTRVSTRLHQPLPEFAVKAAHGKEQQWINEIFKRFEPFIKTPDGEPIPNGIGGSVELYPGSESRYSNAGALVNAYWVGIDILSGVQDLSPIPDAIGTRHSLDHPFDLEVGLSAAAMGAAIGLGQLWEAAAIGLGITVRMVESHLTHVCLYGLLTKETPLWWTFEYDALGYDEYF